MKIFVSLPMRGHTDEDIQNRLSDISATLKEKFKDEEIEIIDSFVNYPPVDSDEVISVPVWYLGRSLQLLSKVDAIYFGAGWKDARGCRIERLVAEEYGIDIIDEAAQPHRTSVDEEEFLGSATDNIHVKSTYHGPYGKVLDTSKS